MCIFSVHVTVCVCLCVCARERERTMYACVLCFSHQAPEQNRDLVNTMSTPASCLQCMLGHLKKKQKKNLQLLHSTAKRLRASGQSPWKQPRPTLQKPAATSYTAIQTF